MSVKEFSRDYGFHLNNRADVSTHICDKDEEWPRGVLIVEGNDKGS